MSEPTDPGRDHRGWLATALASIGVIGTGAVVALILATIAGLGLTLAGLLLLLIGLDTLLAP